jgi:hypothetical protein
VRLNAVQPQLVPPLASGYKVVDLPADFAAALRAHVRGQLAAAGGDPRGIGAPDRRSRIISKDAQNVFHTRISSISTALKQRITTHFQGLISEWVGHPLVYSAGFGIRSYLRNATFAAVSHSCACIGSPCLRHCVHGASIGFPVFCSWCWPRLVAVACWVLTAI